MIKRFEPLSAINWQDLKTTAELQEALENRYGAAVAQDLIDKVVRWDSEGKKPLPANRLAA